MNMRETQKGERIRTTRSGSINISHSVGTQRTMPPNFDEIVIDFADFPTHKELSARQAEKVKAVLIWIIFSHARTYRLTASRLMKLYYMAELRSIEKFGRRLSTVEFVNWHHGPWSQAVAMIADSVHPDYEMERVLTRDGHVAKFYRAAQAPQTETNLDKEETELLDQVIAEWKPRKTVDLITAAKETDPFVASNYGEVIDLDAYTKCWTELRSKTSQDEIERNLAEARAGRGKRFSTPQELRAYFKSL